MAYFLYNTIFYFLYGLYFLLGFFSQKFREDKKRRSLQNVLSYPLKPGSSVYWLHSASVGELDQASAFAKVIKENEPNATVIQSVFSPSVTESQKKYPEADVSFYLPLDLPNAYDPILRKFQPKAIFIMAWDTWPNFLRSGKQAGAKIFLLCASLSENSGRRKGWSKWFTKSSFRFLDGVYPNHPSSEPYFKELLPPNTDLISLGDTRFESVVQKFHAKAAPESFERKIQPIRSTLEKNPPVLFGSTYSICEEYLWQFCNGKEWKTIPKRPSVWIFPHKWETGRMLELQKKLSSLGKVELYSTWNVEEGIPEFLLVDQMGILAFAYSLGRFAYVGGGFHHRIHNTIEPAYCSLPILTGPKIQNAPEAIVMQKLGGLIMTNNGFELGTKVCYLLENPRLVKELGNKNHNFVVENLGASTKIYKRVFQDVSNLHKRH